MNNKLIPLFLFFATFVVYLHNLSPSVYGGDVGDFVTAAVVKGVAHPSGYPLFTLLGILFNALPVSQTPVWKVGLISVFSSSFSVVLMYLIVFELTKRKLLGFITALTLAFIYPFWLYAEIAEVFALNSFFILLLFYLAILYYKRKKMFLLYVLSFFSGLSLSHHEIIVLLFPSLALLILATDWRIILKPSILARCLLLFLLGLLPYIYIPIAASHDPPLNWGNAVTLENFFHLVLRRDYGWAYDQDIDLSFRILSLKAYAAYWRAELPPVLIVSILLGIVHMLLKKQKLLFSSLIFSLFLFGVFYAFYAGVSIGSQFTFGVLERFYMISALFFIIFFPFGIIWITEHITRFLRYIKPLFFKKDFYTNIFSMVFLIVPIFLFSHNFSNTDLHDVWTGDYFAIDLLSPLPQNSIILLKGDSETLNTLYMHYARGLRKDVQIYLPIFADRQIAKDKSLSQKKEEIIKLNKSITNEQANLMTIVSQIPQRRLFFNWDLLYDDTNFSSIPYGLVFELVKSSKKDMDKSDFLNRQEKILNSFHLNGFKKEKDSVRRSLTLSSLRETYAQAFTNTAEYLISHYNDEEKAKIYYEKAIEMDPNMELGYEGLGRYYLNKKNCKKAEEMFSRIISLNPFPKHSERGKAYVWLYGIYDTCFKDKKKAKEIADTYSKLFHIPIYGDSKNDVKEK